METCKSEVWVLGTFRHCNLLCWWCYHSLQASVAPRYPSAMLHCKSALKTVVLWIQYKLCLNNSFICLFLQAMVLLCGSLYHVERFALFFCDIHESLILYERNISVWGTYVWICVCYVSLHVESSYYILCVTGYHPYYSMLQFPHSCVLLLTVVLFLCSGFQAYGAEIW